MLRARVAEFVAAGDFGLASGAEPAGGYRRIWFREDIEPTFAGQSIGKWIDHDGDGKYDVLEVETRNLRGPRTFDYSGLPLSFDNDTVVKEREGWKDLYRACMDVLE